MYDFLPDTPSGPTLVLEFVVGTNLRNRVESRPLSLSETVSVMEQVLSGLAAAHAAGIVHRDVTPENVVLDPQGRAKLIDFGIASLAGQDRLTATLDGLGKVSFAAPEQIARPVDAGPPADVFAAGRLLGFLPSASVEPAEQLAALPGALQALVIRATDPDPARRFVDARAMLAALQAARAAGWEGAPVAPGDALSPDLAVASVVRSLGDGLWLAEVDDTMHAERLACVVAERRSRAETALEARLRGLSPARRASLGQPRVNVTREGVRWCVLGGDDRDLAAQVFLGADVTITGEKVPVVVAAEVLTEVVAEVMTEVVAEVEPAADVGVRPRATPPATWKPGGEGMVSSAAGTVAGVATVVCLLLSPVGGFLALPLVYWVFQSAVGAPPSPPGPVPAPLTRLSPVDRSCPPEVALRVLDDLASLVLLQRAALGARNDPPLAGLRAFPGRAAWYVLAVDSAASPPGHCEYAASAGARRRAQLGVMHIHHRLDRGGAVESMHTYVTHASLCLARLVHAGQNALAGQPPAGIVVEGGRWRLAGGELLQLAVAP